MKDFAGIKFLVSDDVPKDELWFVQPSKAMQLYRDTLRIEVMVEEQPARLLGRIVNLES